MNTIHFRSPRIHIWQRWLLLLILCSVLVFVERAEQLSAAENETHVHIVKAGETLSGIAQRYSVGVRQLASYNGITDLNQIRVGQRLRIPPQNSASSRSSSAGPTATVQRAAPTANPTSPPVVLSVATPTPRTQAFAPALPAHSGEVSYIVHAGDSLTGIGARFGLSVQAIMARNRLPSTRIYVGQRLIIPVNSQLAAPPVPTPTPQPTPTVEFQTNLPAVSSSEE
jgi:LysM repeat protein